MPEMFTVEDVDTGRKLRKFRFQNPLRCLAIGYAYVEAHRAKCPKSVVRYPTGRMLIMSPCDCVDFVVKDEAGRPLSANRCRAIAAYLKAEAAS